jgi:hypothetical protein
VEEYGKSVIKRSRKYQLDGSIKPITHPGLGPLPTLRQLRYLVAVVDRGHFGQAAAQAGASGE